MNENDADAFNNLGITYASMGDFNKARWEFDQAIARKAEFATAYNNRCWLRIAMDDAIHAIEDCSRSLKLDPTDSNTWNSRGWAYLRADQFSKAVDDFNTVLLTDPDSSYALYGLSLAERRLGHSSDADKFLAAAKNRQADVEADLGRQHIWPPS